MSSRFTLIENGKKVTVKQLGNPSFTYPINPITLKCGCTKRNIICEHITFYLTEKGVHPHIIPFLKVPAISSSIRDTKATTGEQITAACTNYLFDDDSGCCICSRSFIAEGEMLPDQLGKMFHMCPACSNIFHLSCHQRWNNGCAICKNGHGAK